MAVADNSFDAIVIGSGISGGWAAKELCEKGLKTLVLERGRNVVHIKDYPTMNLNPWELPHRGAMSRQVLKENPLISKAAGYGEDTMHFFIKDRDHPYVQEKPFDWIRMTFNGDLFPIESVERRSVKSNHLRLVSETLSGVSPATGQASLWPYEFDVIPIELISSIYEQFAHTTASGDTAKSQGLHYTPAPLAGLILDEVMRDLPTGAQILDMTCGSGVFLVEAVHDALRAYTIVLVSDTALITKISRSHILALLFFLASTVFVWRSFHKMRIGTLQAEAALVGVDDLPKD